MAAFTWNGWQVSPEYARIPDKRAPEGYLEVFSTAPRFGYYDLHFDFESIGTVLSKLSVDIKEFKLEPLRTRDDPLSLKLKEFLHLHRNSLENATPAAAWLYVLDDPQFWEGLNCIIFETLSGNVKSVNRNAFNARLRRIKKRLAEFK